MSGPSVQDLVSDEELTEVFAHANYGSMTPREVVKLGLLKTASGYAHGYTSTQILKELGLICKSTHDLTTKGRQYLWAAWSGGNPF